MKMNSKDLNKKDIILIDKIFLLFIFCASITGIGYYLYCLKSGIIQYTTYPENIMLNSGVLPKIIRYSKDILMCALLLLLIRYRFPKIDSFLINLLIIFLYGMIIAFINGLSVSHVVAGVRSFLYFIVGVLYFRTRRLNNELIVLLYKWTKRLIYCNVISIIVFICFSGENNVGNGSYRYIGLFLHTGTLGNYAYAVAIFCSIYYLLYKRDKKLEVYLLQFSCLFLTVASNSRLCIMGVIINIIILFLCSTKMESKSKNISIILVLISFVPIVLSKVLTLSGRGGIEASASGKISFWGEAFSREFLNVIFGHGLGYATQTTAILGLNNSGYSGFDGTLSVFMAQFGIVGVIFIILCVVILSYLIIKMKTNLNLMFKINIISGLIIFGWSGNIFENILMCIYYIIDFYILKLMHMKNSVEVYNE